MNKKLICIALTLLFSACKQENATTYQDKILVDSLRVELVRNKELVDSLKALIHRPEVKPHESDVENENFDGFFWNFMTDSAYQIQRIQFPLPYITWKEELGGEIDTIMIPKSDWEYDSFYINYANERTQIYDNFDLQLRKTNQRLVHWYGVETGGDAKYYFEGHDGRWSLIKKEQLGD